MTERFRILSQFRAALGRYVLLFGPGLSFFLAALGFRQLEAAGDWLGGVVHFGFLTLLCFLTLWGTLSAEPLLVRGSRCACQIASFYFFFLLADVAQGERHERPFPAAAAASILLFVSATFGVAGLLRLFRFRLTNSRGSIGGKYPAPLPVGQFGLAKLFQITTASAIFLGLGVATIPKFRDEPEGCLPGIGHALVVAISLVFCGPIGLLTVLLAWIVMGEGFNRTRIVVGIILGLIWVACALFAFLTTDDYGVILAFWLLLHLGFWMLIFGGIARLLGWRIMRIPRDAPLLLDAAPRQ